MMENQIERNVENGLLTNQSSTYFVPKSWSYTPKDKTYKLHIYIHTLEYLKTSKPAKQTILCVCICVYIYMFIYIYMYVVPKMMGTSWRTYKKDYSILVCVLGSLFLGKLRCKHVEI